MPIQPLQPSTAHIPTSTASQAPSSPRTTTSSRSVSSITRAASNSAPSPWRCIIDIFNWPIRIFRKLITLIRGGNSIPWEQKVVFSSGKSPQNPQGILKALKMAAIDRCAFDQVLFCESNVDQTDWFFSQMDASFGDSQAFNSPGRALIIHSMGWNGRRDPQFFQCVEPYQPSMRVFFNNGNKCVMLSTKEIGDMAEGVVPGWLESILETGEIPPQSQLPSRYQGLVMPHPLDRD